MTDLKRAQDDIAAADYIYRLARQMDHMQDEILTTLAKRQHSKEFNQHIIDSDYLRTINRHLKLNYKPPS